MNGPSLAVQLRAGGKWLQRHADYLAEKILKNNNAKLELYVSESKKIVITFEKGE